LHLLIFNEEIFELNLQGRTKEAYAAYYTGVKFTAYGSY